MRMVQLHQMLLEDTGRDVPIPEIWDHLGELYDLPALEELVRRRPPRDPDATGGAIGTRRAGRW